MLQKLEIDYKDHKTLINESVIIKISSNKELDSIIKLYNTYSGKIKGISLSQTFLETIEKEQLKNSNINYFKIIIDQETLKPLTLAKTKKLNSFTEVMIPFQFYSKDLIQSLTNTNRVIISFENEDQTKELNKITATLLLNKYFPFTKGIPFCHAKIDQTIEIFDTEKSNRKKKKCDSCALKEYCNKPDGFTPKPIKYADKDLIKFLGENESITNRL